MAKTTHTPRMSATPPAKGAVRKPKPPTKTAVRKPAAPTKVRSGPLRRVGRRAPCARRSRVAAARRRTHP